MSISQQQAADALRDIDVTETRSRALRNYQHGSPILFMWGVIWVIGYAASGLNPMAPLIWIPLTIAGILGSALLRRRALKGAADTMDRTKGLRIGLTSMVYFGFCCAAYAVMQPHNPVAYMAFPPLMVALSYSMVGIWFLPRYLWLGIALFALTVGGFFYVPEWFAYWMAIVGGGSLMLGSLWLRKA